MSCVIGLEWQSAVYRLNHGSTAMPNGFTCPRVHTSIREPSGLNRNVCPLCIFTVFPLLSVTVLSLANPWHAYTHPSGMSVYELYMPCVSRWPKPLNSTSILSALPVPFVPVYLRISLKL